MKKNEDWSLEAIKNIEMVADDLFDMNQRAMATVLRMAVSEIEKGKEIVKKLEKDLEEAEGIIDRSQFVPIIEGGECPPAYVDLLFRVKNRNNCGTPYYLVGQYESSTGTYVRAIDKEVILDNVIGWIEIENYQGSEWYL